jgi:hypothetical protein
MPALKRYTADKANRLLARTGQFWQHESYDHVIRTDEELVHYRSYVLNNPGNGRRATASFCRILIEPNLNLKPVDRTGCSVKPTEDWHEQGSPFCSKRANLGKRLANSE